MTAIKSKFIYSIGTFTVGTICSVQLCNTSEVSAFEEVVDTAVCLWTYLLFLKKCSQIKVSTCILRVQNNRVIL